MKESSVKVIFRRYNDRTGYCRIIAIFPEEAKDKNIDHCLAYVRVREDVACFCTASVTGVIKTTVPAKVEDYDFLKKEIEEKGYNLNIKHRISRKMNDLRCERAANC